MVKISRRADSCAVVSDQVRSALPPKILSCAVRSATVVLGAEARGAGGCSASWGVCVPWLGSCSTCACPCVNIDGAPAAPLT